ncbi:hypothetical protein AMELA_G00235810 [Ameiurus melas]|uniref:Ig-like domain-containing protein n=1 Tax=Ameiurus melas TaxID=219545 RepID=A0A7J6A0T1_AMEME|nr:hypothetical protein AMELA_G00235810 [Ameiurus melas]
MPWVTVHGTVWEIYIRRHKLYRSYSLSTSLLVEYGSPAEVNCSIPNKPVTPYLLGWESKSSQPQTSTETSVVWNVTSLMEWEEVEEFRCYLTVKIGTTDNYTQCMSNVNLTIYKRPDSVTLSSRSDVWVEGNQTELRCEIKNVGPGDKLSVRWSRTDPKHGDKFTDLNETSFPDLRNELYSVNKTVNLTVTPRREDDGVQYRCAAVLNVNHPPYVNISEPITITLHYKPIITQPLDEGLSVREGESLMITCSADGNPRPQYKWTVPNNTIVSNSSSFVIRSVRKEDTGQYTCTAYNDLGETTRNVTVTIKDDIWPHWWIILVIIIVLVCGVACGIFYRRECMGQYILTRLMSHRHNGHVGHITEDRVGL